jgi:hypothetical protein
MSILRNYKPGDEQAQVEIYNTAAGKLPAFKVATVEELARRYGTTDRDPSSKFFAVEGGLIVGYAVTSAQGRVSYPWCRPGFDAEQPALLEAVLAALRVRGVREAWAAYRADWEPVIHFFRNQGFGQTREMINYVGELQRLPSMPVPAELLIAPLDRAEVPGVLAIGGSLFQGEDEALVEGFFWENPYLDPGSLYTLRRSRDGSLVGVGLVVVRAGYADPLKIDAAMPCFRLGALGTETQRHKRVNGLFSCIFASESAGDVLLGEAVRRVKAAGLSHAAAQVPSDRPELVAFYDRYFQRQGSFPILAKSITA